MSSVPTIPTVAKHIFLTRLDALSHLLDRAEQHFGDDLPALLDRRLAPDMFPLGTQIVFTCNQPSNFALWYLGESRENRPKELTDLAEGRSHIASTKELVQSITSDDDSRMSATKRIELGQGRYLEFQGVDYLNEFVLPNFYFHLTTVYAILRMAGANIGKQDFLPFLAPFLKQKAD